MAGISAEKNLYLAESFVSPVASALQELVEGRTTGASHGFAYPAKYFRGRARAIGTCSGRDSTVRCCATGRRSPYSRFTQDQLIRLRTAQVLLQ